MAKDDLTSIMTEYPYMPLRDVVFHTLRRAIMQGDLKPGERLMEIKLANRLGVSRTPIREAIRMLELEGLVTMVPRKGAQVAEITEKDLKDVLEVRIGLEELAVKFVCQRIDDRQLRELQEAAPFRTSSPEELPPVPVPVRSPPYHSRSFLLYRLAECLPAPSDRSPPRTRRNPDRSQALRSERGYCVPSDPSPLQ